MINLGIDNAQNFDPATAKNSSNRYEPLRFTKTYIDLITKGPAPLTSRGYKCAAIAARITILFSLLIILITLLTDLLFAISHRFYGENLQKAQFPTAKVAPFHPNEDQRVRDEEIFTPASSPFKADRIIVLSQKVIGAPSSPSPAPNTSARSDFFTPRDPSTPGSVQNESTPRPSVSSAIKISPFEENEQSPKTDKRGQIISSISEEGLSEIRKDLFCRVKAEEKSPRTQKRPLHTISS